MTVNDKRDTAHIVPTRVDQLWGHMQLCITERKSEITRKNTGKGNKVKLAGQPARTTTSQQNNKNTNIIQRLLLTVKTVTNNNKQNKMTMNNTNKTKTKLDKCKTTKKIHDRHNKPPTTTQENN